MSEDKKQAITAKKAENFSEWYTQLVERAELADIRYGIKGFVVYREWAQITMEKMFRIMSDALDMTGHMPIVLPTLIPEKNFTIEADHVEGFAPEVFWVTETGAEKKLEEKFALRPTSETAFYQMYSLWIQSYRDLPYKRYQRGSVFRAEKSKATRPFFRGKEFHWIEAHNAFATEEDAMKQVEQDMQITQDVLYNRFGIPHIFFKRPHWDKFPGAVHTFAADALMGSGKVLQLPSTHYLGENFSKPFDVTYLDSDGASKHCHITCYGPAISRIYGALIALHSDDKGLRLPFELSPVQIVIVPIFKEGKEKVVMDYCNQLAGKLRNMYSVYVDGREGYSPGWKFNQWELKGVPIRIEVGPRDLEQGTAVVARRDLNEKKEYLQNSLPGDIAKIANNYTATLIAQAESSFEENTVEAHTMDGVKAAIGQDKIVKVCFCSTGPEGTECAASFEEQSGGFIRGERAFAEEEVQGLCPGCNKPAKSVVYVAKSY